MIGKYKLNIGSRAQVMHGTAKKTVGGLIKKQLKYNKQGKIVSKKASNTAKKLNKLVKAGYITRKGHFGSFIKGGAVAAPLNWMEHRPENTIESYILFYKRLDNDSPSGLELDLLIKYSKSNNKETIFGDIIKSAKFAKFLEIIKKYNFNSPYFQNGECLKDFDKWTCFFICLYVYTITVTDKYYHIIKSKMNAYFDNMGDTEAVPFIEDILNNKRMVNNKPLSEYKNNGIPKKISLIFNNSDAT